MSSDARTTLRSLAAAIATDETGEDPPPTDKKKSVYISLHQTHLPTLETHGIVEYDRSSKRIELCDGVEEVSMFIEPDTPSEISGWYPFASAIALLTIIAASVGLPVFSSVDVLVWAVVFLGMFVAFGVVDRIGLTKWRDHGL
jgi:hypothetical protein